MKPISLGIVGLGRAGKNMHLRELAGKEEMFRLTAVCDLVNERCDAVSNKYGVKSYERIEDLIADPEIELVDIATRSCDHFRHAKMALAAGKHVFLEKPYAIHYEDAEELTHLSNQPGGPRLFVRHNRRWEAKFNQVMRLCDDGMIGDVFEVRLTRDAFGGRNDWQTIREFGGGQLLNWGPHIVDHALNFCGGDYKSLWADLKQVNASGDCEDCVHIVFEGVNGRLVDMEINSAAALPTPQYLAYGSRGALEDRGDTLHIRRLIDAIRWKNLRLIPEIRLTILPPAIRSRLKNTTFPPSRTKRLTRRGRRSMTICAGVSHTASK